MIFDSVIQKVPMVSSGSVIREPSSSLTIGGKSLYMRAIETTLHPAWENDDIADQKWLRKHRDRTHKLKKKNS